MPCESIMLTGPETIGPDKSLWEGVMVLARKGYRTLPVTAPDSSYCGALTRTHVLRVILPSAATIEHGLTDLGYVRGQVPRLRERLRASRDRPIAEILQDYDVEVPVVKPDTPIIEGLRLLYSFGFGIPVVDGAHKLVGLITGHSALRAFVELEE